MENSAPRKQRAEALAAALVETLPPPVEAERSRPAALRIEAMAAHLDVEPLADGRSATLAGDLPDAALARTLASDPSRNVLLTAPALKAPVASWDRYEIGSLLGRGGMGEVYKARDRRIGRAVALKFIRGGDEVMTHRFMQEARAQSRIDHPFVCKVHEVGEVEGKPYIAMQLVAGQALDKAAASMSLVEKVRLIRDAAQALHAAHELGIIHRDIKPSNIMVEKGADGALRPIIMDFGLAREAGEGKGLTESGAVIGTPAYMSPEQARGEARHLDRRTDVYSLGATLFDILTGKPPFDDTSVVSILLKVTGSPAPLLRSLDPSLPEALELITSKCLNKEPAQRYSTGLALAEDLDRYLSAGRITARRLSYAYRTRYWARQNPSLAGLVAALVCSLLGFTGYGVRTAIVSARSEEMARRRAALAQKLGQAVKDLEWLVRSAYLVPLHDTGPEKAAVRARMAEIETEMRSFGGLAAGLDHYALGRGHLALKQWDAAYRELRQAEEQGVREPELDYSLGRVLGELYSRALEEARKSGDKSFFVRRQKELEKEYLVPTRAYLQRSRGLKTVSASYLEGLIDFYHQRYDAALLNAEFARRNSSWLYEATALQGDVYMARALDDRDRGDNEQADAQFQLAVAKYEQAAEIGRSDPQLYEALSEAWVRQEELDMFRGRDPRPKLARALAAAEQALAAAPMESSGHTKQAFAYYFQAQYSRDHGAPPEVIDRLFRAQITAGKQAIELHPQDAYAHDVTGMAYDGLAESLSERGAQPEDLFAQAFLCFENAIRLRPDFPWAYNDYGVALGAAGNSKKKQNADPREFYKRATDIIKKAIALDDHYLLAYSNAAANLESLAEWQAEHGEDPQVNALAAIEMADRALQINKQQPLAYGNSGGAFGLVAEYRLDAGLDGREAARKAIDRFRSLLAIDPNFLGPMADLARSYLRLASHERRLKIDPQPDLEKGLDVLGACYRLEPGNVECLAVEAQLRAEQVEWARQQGAPPATGFEKARRLAREATQKARDRGDLWMALGQICLQYADALRAGQRSSAKRAPVVEEGLRAVERSLQLAPGLPRALALKGALYLRSAELVRDPEKKKALLTRAQEARARGGKANPLLGRRDAESAASAADAVPSL
jgi:serine/threonine-protein kinase